MLENEVQGTKNVTKVTDDILTRMRMEDNMNIYGTRFTYEARNKSMQNVRNCINIQNRKEARHKGKRNSRNTLPEDFLINKSKKLATGNSIAVKSVN